MQSFKSPLGLALFAYAWWGFVPAYWKQIPQFPALELILWRVVFSSVSLLPFLAWRKDFSSILRLLRSPSSTIALIGTAGLIGFNWSLYIWAVTSGHILESSLGYFLNPLLNMALGTILLKERLNRTQWLAFSLAAAGVAWLTWSAGKPPWIALLLALSFTLYGLGRKLARLPTLPATSVETFFLTVPAALGIFFLASRHGLHAPVANNTEWAWLSLSGLVTTIPLLAFAEAAVRLPLSVLGFVQFVSPSLQFLLGVMVYREPFTAEKGIGFALIWTGLAFFLADLAKRSRFAKSPKA
jgi:chloramphenicol-sensitive protein RarD